MKSISQNKSDWRAWIEQGYSDAWKGKKVFEEEEEEEDSSFKDYKLMYSTKFNFE